LSANFYDLKLIKGHDTLYIEDVFPSFEHNTSLTLVVRSDFCTLLGLLAYLRKAHLFGEEIFGKFMVFFLKEGLQLGFACYFLDDF
jgi:hypothetical protein